MSLQLGDTVGVIQLVKDLGGEPQRFVVRCRCDREFEMFLFAIEELRDILPHTRCPAFPPYVCHCKYDVAFWEARAGAATSKMTDTPEYRIWYSLKQGCCDKESTRWASLGAKGYKLCRRWQLSFDDFLEDMGRKPDGKVLVIQQNERTYSKSTCVWASRQEWRSLQKQAAFFTFDGVQKTVTEWAQEFSSINGDSIDCNRNRMLRGWSRERILSVHQQKEPDNAEPGSGI